MSQILKSPSKYIQGAGVLQQLDQYLYGMGKSLLVLISESGTRRIGPILEHCFAPTDYVLHYAIFRGECSQGQIDSLTESAKALDATAVIGVGGGKILDAAKGVGYYTGLPVVIIPTVASTDSPCSSLSVIYRDNGEFERYLFLDRCPDMVLVDTDVIAKAPAKLLVAGMGDAMATYFEARACRASGSNNQVAGKPTLAASGLAAMCWKYLQKEGRAAKEAVESKTCNAAVETIVEVNTYLSSVGFESGGLAAAHAIQKGFTFIPQLHQQYHGCKVAFCTLVQLILEESWEEVSLVLDFCTGVGLPVCFADMGYETVEPELLQKAARQACAPGSTIHHMPFPVTPRMVYEAMGKADELGKIYKAAGSMEKWLREKEIATDQRVADKKDRLPE